MAEPLSGADELRAIVRWLDYHRESFLDRFTAEQLIALWRHGQARPRVLDEMADTWSEADIREAIKGTPNRREGCTPMRHRHDPRNPTCDCEMAQRMLTRR